MIIDTHSHLNFNAYKNDLDEVVKRTIDSDVVCINVGTKYETSKDAVELAEKYDEMYAAIGLHPFFAGAEFIKIKIDSDEGDFLVKEQDFDAEKYKELAKSKKVVAIGEIGLDYYYRPKIPTAKSRLSRGLAKKSEPSRIHDADFVGIGTKLEQFKQKQKQVFLQQLDLARDLDLPVIMHCRMAHDDLVKILGAQVAVSYKEIKGVVHCFTGSVKEMEQYLNLGFYVGLNGIIFKMDLGEVIKKCPLESILVETDCPYLTPPSEGKDKRNEPIFVKHVIQKIADLKGISFDEVAKKTTENAKELFKI